MTPEQAKQRMEDINSITKGIVAYFEENNIPGDQRATVGALVLMSAISNDFQSDDHKTVIKAACKWVRTIGKVSSAETVITAKCP